MHHKQGFTHLFALILAAVMTILLLPAAAFAEGETDGTSDSTTDGSAASSITYTTSILDTSAEDSTALTIESFFTRQDSNSEVTKPCDIIFVVDQSKWMNTESDSGATRETIINAMQTLLTDLKAPSYGEHRVAVAGYGRLNMNVSNAYMDSYDSTTYPGIQASGDYISLNTGYYTKDGFVSQKGWTDLEQSAMTSAALPTMSNTYRASMTYDTAFMTLTDAKAVLTVDKMLAWYAGAARLDAGLSIAEQLASVAKTNATATEEDRNLIVCILASSLPIQNTGYNNVSTIRTAAVQVAADQLKAQGATVLAFGDYHASGKADLKDDTPENFTATMKEVCTESEYFYAFDAETTVSEAMNGLVSNIETVAGTHETAYTIEVDEFTETTETGEEEVVTWSEILASFGSESKNVVNATTATVKLYLDTGVDEEGTPTFDDDPVRTLEIPLADLVTEDGISYTVALSSFYGEDEEANIHDRDYKVEIQMNLPITSSYQVQHWYEQLDGSYTLAEDQTQTITDKIGATVTATANTTDHYQLNEGKSTLSGTVKLFSGAEDQLILPLYYDLDTVTVSYDLNYEGADSTDYPTETVKYGATVTVKAAPSREGYDFLGWTIGESSYSSGDTLTVTEDITLVAQWKGIVTVSYDLNGGDAGSTDYSTETVECGTTVTVKGEPTINGGWFIGWLYNGQLYQAEDQLAVTENVVFVAQWGTITPTGVESEQIPWLVLFFLSLTAAVAFVFCKIRKMFHK
jgi:uncharacterized repeat protein (TIGR02543 family)